MKKYIACAIVASALVAGCNYTGDAECHAQGGILYEIPGDADRCLIPSPESNIPVFDLDLVPKPVSYTHLTLPTICSV